jgi:hypothetical protein
VEQLAGLETVPKSLETFVAAPGARSRPLADWLLDKQPGHHRANAAGDARLWRDYTRDVLGRRRLVAAVAAGYPVSLQKK